MTSRMKKRDLFIGDEYWNESDKRITPFDFDDDSEGYAFMKSVSAADVTFTCYLQNIMKVSCVLLLVFSWCILYCWLYVFLPPF